MYLLFDLVIGKASIMSKPTRVKGKPGLVANDSVPLLIGWWSVHLTIMASFNK